MPQVICTLQNMSGSVSGVAFTRAPEGFWQSEVLTEEQANLFAAIPGYAYVQDPPPEPLTEPPTTPSVPPPRRMRHGNP